MHYKCTTLDRTHDIYFAFRSFQRPLWGSLEFIIYKRYKKVHLGIIFIFFGGSQGFLSRQKKMPPKSHLHFNNWRTFDSIMIQKFGWPSWMINPCLSNEDQTGGVHIVWTSSFEFLSKNDAIRPALQSAPRHSTPIWQLAGMQSSGMAMPMHVSLPLNFSSCM